MRLWSLVKNHDFSPYEELRYVSRGNSISEGICVEVLIDSWLPFSSCGLAERVWFYRIPFREA